MAISTLAKRESVPIPSTTSPILLTGATGYIGGRLLHVLQNAGHRVRCMTRRPEALQSCVAPTTEVVSGNVLDGDSLKGTMEGVEIAYYMVHSMGSKGDFEEQDRRAAHNFGARGAARRRQSDYLSRRSRRERVGNCPRILEADRRSPRSCAHRGCRSSSFAPPLSLVLAVCRLR